MENQSKIIILRGNSGSGKSTVAKVLQKKLGRGTLLISQDFIRREMLWVNDGIGTKAISLLLEITMYGKNNFSSIYAYYYDLPFDETVRRHHTKPNSNEFGEIEMKRWWKEKDYIEIIPEKILTKELDLSETVDMIYNDVMNS